MTSVPADVIRFVRGEIDPADFSHREHVRMAFEMLRRHEFVETAWHYSRALRALTVKAGKPEKFHQTLTIAFLSVIAERLIDGGQSDFEDFAAAHPDLLDPTILGRWYDPERLASEAARTSFVLPAPAETT